MLTAASFALLAAAAQPTAGEVPVYTDPAPALTLAQDDPATDPKWEGSVAVGISVTDGNTDITKASATADATKKLDKERYTLGLSWNFSEESNTITQRKTYGKAQYDRFVSDKMYWLAQASAEADATAGVDLRATLGAGVGYQFSDTEKWKLNGEAGLAYFSESFKNGDDNDYVSARLAYNWAYILSSKWAFEQFGTIFPSLENADDIYTKIDTRAKVTLTDNMFAQAQWVWDWDNTPAVGADRSDHLLLITLGWSF